jgi:hypothetical protein
MSEQAAEITGPVESGAGMGSIIDIKQLEVKDLIGLVSFWASACALLFDIGFFFGVGIDLYTFFSLVEHLSFGLRLLPVALVIALAIIFFSGQNIEDRIVEEQLLKTGKWRRVEVKTIPARDKILGIGGAAAMLPIAYFLLSRNVYWQGTAAAIVAASVVYCSFSVAFRQRSMWIPYLAICLSIMAFVVGVDVGVAGVTADKVTDLVYSTREPNCYTAHVVRSGEEGLLFVDLPSKQLTFLKKEGFKKIVSVAEKQEGTCGVTKSAPAPLNRN